MVSDWTRLFAVAVGYIVIALATAFALIWYTHYSLGFVGVYAVLLALPAPIIVVTYFLELYRKDVRVKVVITCFLTYLMVYVLLNLLPHFMPWVTQVLNPYSRLLKDVEMLVLGWGYVTVLAFIYKVVTGKG